MWHVSAHGRLYQRGSKNVLYTKNTFFPTKATQVFLLIMHQYITNHTHQYLELLLQMLIHWHVCSLALFS
jgi:hypothetical protein